MSTTIDPASILASLRRRVAERLTQHRENLAGWSEGRPCPFLADHGKMICCPCCSQTGIKAGTQGYLVPTEPDPAERAAVRRELQAAIMELEGIEREIGKGD